MIVHRFMSEVEYNMLMQGAQLRNDNRHEGFLTTSVGFCFFTEPPDEAIHWLSGCCDPERCVTMEIDRSHLQTAIGHYRNPKGGKMNIVECCCTTYSLKIAKVLSVTDKYKELADARRLLRMFGLIR